MKKAGVLRFQQDRRFELQDGLPKRLPVLHDPFRLPQSFGRRHDPQSQGGCCQIAKPCSNSLFAQRRRQNGLRPPLPGQTQLKRTFRVLRMPGYRCLKRRNGPGMFAPQTEFRTGDKRRILANCTHRNMLPGGGRNDA